MFAAIDDANPASAVLPAHLNSCIAVRAATRNLSNADKECVDFAVPMEGIEVDFPAYLEDGRKRKTAAESSYAAALATGLASLLLLAARYTFRTNNNADAKFQQLKRTQHMKDFLERLVKPGNAKVLQPWETVPEVESLKGLLQDKLGRD